MKSKFRSSIFIFFVILLSLLLGGNYWIQNKNAETIKKEFLKSVNNDHLISCDDLADRIINDDPGILLLDIRTSSEYKKYHIPEAIHVKLDSTLSYLSTNTELIQNSDVILISNDAFNAEMIYNLVTDNSNIQVLDGGMQSWYNTIINPKDPGNNADELDINKFTARKGASMYFGVKYPEKVIEKPAPKKVTPPKKVVPKKKKKKLPIEGGC